MKNVGVKDYLIQSVIHGMGTNAEKNIRPIPGFRGLYMVIAAKETKVHFDSTPTVCNPGVNILTTYDCNRIKLLKPWRAKRNGKPYGSTWVALRDNDGKKKYFKPEKLAEEIFGERWEEVNQQIKTRASKIALDELF